MPKYPKWASAFRTMEERFRKAAKVLSEEGLHGSVRIHHNKDGSVDGEMRVKTPRGVTANRTFLALEESIKVPIEMWMTVGGHFMPRNETEAMLYRNWQKHTRMETYAQRTPSKAYTFQRAREFNKRMLKRGRRKVEEIFVRLFYDPRGKQPELKGGRKKRKRKSKGKK